MYDSSSLCWPFLFSPSLPFLDILNWDHFASGLISIRALCTQLNSWVDGLFQKLGKFCKLSKEREREGGKGINLEKKMKYLESGHDVSGHGRHSASGSISECDIVICDILYLTI